MYIFLPLTLILGSCIGIAVIVWRKMPYLSRLTPESHEAVGPLWQELFPELMNWFRGLDMAEYKKASLQEAEKLLRRLRVMSLRVDHLSGRAIKKIRKVHVNNTLEQVVAVEAAPEVQVVEISAESPIEELKKEEQRLIIEIAQNPKDPNLFNALGDLYLKMDSSEDAKESYEAALALNPLDGILARKYSKLLQTLTATK